jgi:hypothetical protein
MEEQTVTENFEKFLRIQRKYGYSDKKIIEEFMSREKLKGGKELFLSVCQAIRQAKKFWGAKPSSAVECIARLQGAPKNKRSAIINLMNTEYIDQPESKEWLKNLPLEEAVALRRNKNSMIKMPQFKQLLNDKISSETGMELSPKQRFSLSRLAKAIESKARTTGKTVSTLPVKKSTDLAKVKKETVLAKFSDNEFPLVDAVDIIAEIDFFFRLMRRPEKLHEYQEEILECYRKVNSLRRFVFASNGTKLVAK